MEFRSKLFRKRIRLTQYQLAQRLGCDQSLVAAWEGGKFPTYEKICMLIDIGITADELLGPELAKKLLYNSRSVSRPEAFDSEEFQNAVLEKMTDMKARNIIKDEVQKTIDEMRRDGRL